MKVTPKRTKARQARTAKAREARTRDPRLMKVYDMFLGRKK